MNPVSQLRALQETQDKMSSIITRGELKQARSALHDLTPAMWWNDMTATALAAHLATQHVGALQNVARVAASYAKASARLAGKTADTHVSLSFRYPRDTTPFTAIFRTFDAYRAKAVETPDLRPQTWQDGTDPELRTISSWIASADQQLERTFDTDAQLTALNTTRRHYYRYKVLRYVRILHPELSRTGSCGLCVVAANRGYSVKELMPIHAHCHCSVAPWEQSHIAGTLNDDDLERFYEAAGGRTAAKLTQVRVLTVNNAEIGPVLQAADLKPPRHVKQYETPTRRTTISHLEQDAQRYEHFAHATATVMRTGRARTERIMGRNYTFKPADKQLMRAAKATFDTAIAETRAASQS